MAKGRAEKMYENGPKITKGEDGKPRVTREKEKVVKNAGDEAENTSGMEHMIPPHVKHAVERRGMHHKHETEHMISDHNKEDKKEMHKRHVEEMTHMHDKHEKEMKGHHETHSDKEKVKDETHDAKETKPKGE